MGYYVNVQVYYRKEDWQKINPYAGPSLISWDIEYLYSFETAYVPEIREIMMIDKYDNISDKHVEKPYVVEQKIRIDSLTFAVIVTDYQGLPFEVKNKKIVKKEYTFLNEV